MRFTPVISTMVAKSTSRPVIRRVVSTRNTTSSAALSSTHAAASARNSQDVDAHHAFSRRDSAGGYARDAKYTAMTTPISEPTLQHGERRPRNDTPTSTVCSLLPCCIHWQCVCRQQGKGTFCSGGLGGVHATAAGRDRHIVTVTSTHLAFFNLASASRACASDAAPIVSIGLHLNVSLKQRLLRPCMRRLNDAQ